MDGWPRKESVGVIRSRKLKTVSKGANSSGSSKVDNPIGRSLRSSSSSQCGTSMEIDATVVKSMAKALKDFEAEPSVRVLRSQEQGPAPVAHPQGPTTEGNEPSAPKDAQCKGDEPVLPVSMQLDYDWLRTLHRQSVSALQSPAPSEKEFMNLWNDFILCPERMPSLAMKDPYKSLRQFVIENRQTIVDRSLGVSLLTHSNVFRDLGQITSAQWREVMFTIFTKGKLG